MEEGVVKETLKTNIGELFDFKQLLTGISGSGNNWYNWLCYVLIIDMLGHMDTMNMDASIKSKYWTQ